LADLAREKDLLFVTGKAEVVYILTGQGYSLVLSVETQGQFLSALGKL
jgi:hypothetical protein